MESAFSTCCSNSTPQAAQRCPSTGRIFARHAGHTGNRDICVSGAWHSLQWEGNSTDSNPSAGSEAIIASVDEADADAHSVSSLGVTAVYDLRHDHEVEAHPDVGVADGAID